MERGASRAKAAEKSKREEVDPAQRLLLLHHQNLRESKEEIKKNYHSVLSSCRLSLHHIISKTVKLIRLMRWLKSITDKSILI